MKYSDFIKNKSKINQSKGLEIEKSQIHPMLFEYQKDMVLYALRIGKAGIFTTTGTGKTFMQIEFANQVYKNTGKNALILCPLAVTEQTIKEGKKIDIEINNIRKNGHKEGLNIINYEQLHNVSPDLYDAVVLDEASILKSFSGKIRNQIMDMFTGYSFKACFSATPSPNDFMELGNYSEFLDVMKRSEMLATFFIHDSGQTQKWRLKGHAKETFWEWFSSFAVMMNNPNDLGYDEKNYYLPELIRHEHKIKTHKCLEGNLFPISAETLSERRDARRQTLAERCEKVAGIVNSSDQIWIVWCQYNNESEMLKNLIKDAVEVSGSTPDEKKEQIALDFASGKIKCLVTKPSIFGFGMNFQVCHNQTFFPDDSFEQFFQAEKRTYRLGQKHNVNTHLVFSDLEGNVLDNLKRKELQFQEMIESMVDHSKRYVKDNLRTGIIKKDSGYNPEIEMKIPNFLSQVRLDDLGGTL